MTYWWEAGRLLDALRNIEQTEGGFIYEDRELQLRIQSSGYRAARPLAATFTGLAPLAGEIPIVGQVQSAKSPLRTW